MGYWRRAGLLLHSDASGKARGPQKGPGQKGQGQLHAGRQRGGNGSSGEKQHRQQNQGGRISNTPCSAPNHPQQPQTQLTSAFQTKAAAAASASGMSWHSDKSKRQQAAAAHGRITASRGNTLHSMPSSQTTHSTPKTTSSHQLPKEGQQAGHKGDGRHVGRAEEQAQREGAGRRGQAPPDRGFGGVEDGHGKHLRAKMTVKMWCARLQAVLHMPVSAAPRWAWQTPVRGR